MSSKIETIDDALKLLVSTLPSIIERKKSYDNCRSEGFDTEGRHIVRHSLEEQVTDGTMFPIWMKFALAFHSHGERELGHICTMNHKLDCDDLIKELDRYLKARGTNVIDTKS